MMAAATKLTFTTSPNTNMATQPVVTAQDGNSATDSTFSGPISIFATPGTGSPGAALNGVVTMIAVAGVCTFASVTMSQIGTGFTLTAVSAQLTDGTSSSFNVTSAPQRDTYTVLLGLVRPKVGLLSDGTDEPANYLAEWPTLVTAARNDVANDLLIASSPVGHSVVAIQITGDPTYDLSAVGFLRIDTVNYGTDTNQIAVPVQTYTQATAYYGSNPEQTTTAAPACYWWDGGNTLGFAPIPTDTTSLISISGVRLLADMTTSTNRSGIGPMCNECVAYAAAMRMAGEYDPERPDHRLRLPALKEGYQRELSQLITLMRTFAPQPGGYAMAQEAATAMNIYTMRGRRY